jgi:seryl-tRNA synthetase
LAKFLIPAYISSHLYPTALEELLSILSVVYCDQLNLISLKLKRFFPMLDIKDIRANPELILQAINKKNLKFDLDGLLEMDKALIAKTSELQELQTERNANAKKIPQSTPGEREGLIARGKEIGNKIEALKPECDKLKADLNLALLRVPNIPSEDAPLGLSDADNVEIKRSGVLPDFSKFAPKDHVQLLEAQNWAEFERVSRVCGSRSYSLKGEILLLEMALHNFALTFLQARDFTLISAPALVREEALIGTGHFPDGKDQVYHLPEDNLYLSGTAEVQMNSLHSGEILSEAQLPLLYTGYSPCFRREAGSYGRDVRGLIRVHQFTKVEQYILCKADKAEAEKWHQKLLNNAEEIVTALELPYRIVECCTGDMGLGKYRMYDIECWVPSEKKYRETHSCSSLLDWQARRSQLRYRDGEGKIHFCYTLNNTAIATPRILVPFLEHHQREDGTINIPAKLRPYLVGLTNPVLGKPVKA